MFSWRYTINVADILRNPALTFEQRRGLIVNRIRLSKWFQQTMDQDNLQVLLEWLDTTETPTEFDEVWDEVYSMADEERVWIETRVF